MEFIPFGFSSHLIPLCLARIEEKTTSFLLFQTLSFPLFGIVLGKISIFGFEVLFSFSAFSLVFLQSFGTFMRMSEYQNMDSRGTFDK